MSALATPLFSLPDDSPWKGLVLKREDQSETGSHKSRYFKDKLQQLKQDGISQVVLSTTGNAGITAARYGKELGIQVFCLMSEKGNMAKAAQIEAEGGVLMLTHRPVRFAKYMAKKYGIPLLRMSQDEGATDAYKTLGEELIQQVPDAEAIVNFGTSGTSSLGIIRAYLNEGKTLPALHLVQQGKSSSVVQALHPQQIDQFDLEQSVGLASTPHQEALLEAIAESKGDAHYVSKEALKKRDARAILDSFGVQTSWEGECSFLAAQKLLGRYQKIVVILSGKQWLDATPKSPQYVESFAEVDAVYTASSQ